MPVKQVVVGSDTNCEGINGRCYGTTGGASKIKKRDRFCTVCLILKYMPDSKPRYMPHDTYHAEPLYSEEDVVAALRNLLKEI